MSKTNKLLVALASLSLVLVGAVATASQVQAGERFEPFKAGVFAKPLSDATLQEIPGMFLEGEFVIIQRNSSVGTGNKCTNIVTVNCPGMSRTFKWSSQGSQITFVDSFFLTPPLP